MPPLILASTSRYRAALLGRLGLPFARESPGVDEAAQPGEAPAALAGRLARAKALAVAARRPDAIVIGSDQVCACGDALLGKPGTAEQAVAQLRQLSGRTAQFITAVCVVRGATVQAVADLTTVRLRALSDAEIRRYVAAEPALDCAGSFKCEGLGIALFEAIETRDPTALEGLPLIALCGLLRGLGVPLP